MSHSSSCWLPHILEPYSGLLPAHTHSPHPQTELLGCVPIQHVDAFFAPFILTPVVVVFTLSAEEDTGRRSIMAARAFPPSLTFS
ncbi:uncharacterized [Tachysurus ichikawai]